MRRVFKVLVAVCLFLGCYTFDTEAASPRNEFSIGYELGDGLDPGGLKYNLNLGYGYQYEENNQIRLDIIYHQYDGVSWDASFNNWPADKSKADASSTLTAVIVSIRPYILQELPRNIRAYLQIGMGYYVLLWDDIHPEEGSKYLIAPVIGIGVQ